jgi:hypothetical protein
MDAAGVSFPQAHLDPNAMVPFLLSLRRRRKEKPRIVVLCDMSYSVSHASRFMLLLLQTLHKRLMDVRSFIFIREVEELFRSFYENNYNRDRGKIRFEAKEKEPYEYGTYYTRGKKTLPNGLQGIHHTPGRVKRPVDRHIKGFFVEIPVTIQIGQRSIIELFY